MNNRTTFDAKYIMNLPVGLALDELVTRALEQYGVKIDTGLVPYTPQWSTERAEALDLMDTIDERVDQVGILRMSLDAPEIISQMAEVGGEGERAVVFTGDWKESLCKAFLLYVNGHRGEYMHPRWEAAMEAATIRD